MLTTDNTGLVIVDMQGKLARIMHESEQLIRNIAILIKMAQQLSLPIIWLEQNPEKLGATAPELSEILTKQQQPISKMTFDGCQTAEMEMILANAEREHWLIAGIEAHVCVYQTAQGLVRRGYQPEILTDCVSARNPDNKNVALSRMERQGIAISSLEMAIFEILEDCSSDAFRDFVRLIK